MVKELSGPAVYVGYEHKGVSALVLKKCSICCDGYRGTHRRVRKLSPPMYALG
jgi:hypothetical protein